jgi:TolB-like protein/DNA-binding winged helix-turn-helix (wHTH) protein/tetratricopeptide (TPR) repeat protein
MAEFAANSPVLKVDIGRHELLIAGQPVHLENLPFDLLVLLVENRDSVVSRDQIVDRLWGREVFVVTDKNINVAIRKIRKALGDDAEHPRLIQTVVGKGYRFIGSVSLIPSVTERSNRLSLPDASENQAREHPARKGLSGLAAFAVLIAIVVITVLAWRNLVQKRETDNISRRHAMRSLVVLPFENLSRDSTEGYFVDGMTDLLITDLSNINALRVIARSSAMRYKSTTKSVSAIGRELKVDVALEGTVLRAGGRLRITAQLIDARSDRPIWAGRYERDLRDVLTLQNEIATVIVREIKVRLTSDERIRFSRSRSVKPVAHDAYLRGVYEWNRWEPGAKQAAEYFKLATEEDPEYELAFVGLAGAYSHFGIMGALPPKEAWEKARNAAVKALELDESSGEAHAALAYIKSRYDWDWPGSEAEFRRAIELNPNYATAHHWYGLLLAEVGRFDEAISETERAEDLDPLSVLISASLGRRFYLARQFERAAAQFQKTLRMDPTFGLAFSGLGAAYVEQRRYAEALQILNRGARIAKANPETLPVLGFAYAISGDKIRAREILNQLQTPSKTHYVSPYFTALIHAGMGENGPAINDLERARSDHSNWMTLLRSEPLFDGLRSDSRFHNILQKLGFPQEPAPRN